MNSGARAPPHERVRRNSQICCLAHPVRVAALEIGVLSAVDPCRGLRSSRQCSMSVNRSKDTNVLDMNNEIINAW